MRSSHAHPLDILSGELARHRGDIRDLLAVERDSHRGSGVEDDYDVRAILLRPDAAVAVKEAAGDHAGGQQVIVLETVVQFAKLPDCLDELGTETRRM